jgi:hypothetical protein
MISFFRHPVHFAYKILAAPAFNGQTIQLIEVAHDDLASTACGLDRHIQHGMHGLFHGLAYAGCAGCEHAL